MDMQLEHVRQRDQLLQQLVDFSAGQALLARRSRRRLPRVEVQTDRMLQLIGKELAQPLLVILGYEWHGSRSLLDATVSRSPFCSLQQQWRGEQSPPPKFAILDL